MKRLLTALFMLLAITAIVFYGMFSSLKVRSQQTPQTHQAPSPAAQTPPPQPGATPMR